MHITKSKTGTLTYTTNLIVADNHENDTCFQVGLVMGIAVCMIYAALDKIP